MDLNITDFFVYVSIQILYYSNSLNSDANILASIDNNYRIHYKDRLYNKSIQSFLLKNYKEWLFHSKIHHEYQLTFKKPKPRRR